ncbi:HpcH/HpaI aldolase/citrate lyase family protein [Microbulbifer sp. EKSA005]|uniref:HpcH/HpaI aldolase/citrate lyase family protein n=1 Tax=Microbulbifer sp. EKSA005 TaxID=3243364 RepID=UPI0040423C51
MGSVINRSKYFRSVLFVPATRPDRYEKAMASGADIACVDLENAVSLEDKDTAREQMVNFFTGKDIVPTQRALRINQLDSDCGIKDMLMLLDLPQLPDVVILPKVQSAEEVIGFCQVMAPSHKTIRIIALIESPKGLENALSIAQVEEVVCLAFGAADYSATVGSDMSWDALLYGRGRLVQAAAFAGIDAVDGPYLELDDERSLIEETQRVSALGFSGKIAIHPKQIKPIHQGLAPSSEALSHAQRVLKAYKENHGGVLVVDGQMVDMPVVERALKTVAASKGL